MTISAHRGAILHFLDDPTLAGSQAWEYYPDGILLIDSGYIAACGDADTLLASLPADVAVHVHDNAILCPGFIDCHVHYPQLDIMGSHGEQLLAWLDSYVFPAEARFANKQYASEVAQRFLAEQLRHGTTTALVFGTVHPQSVDAFFEACERLGLRMIAGKVLMDRNAPAELRDTPESAYRDSQRLINDWHGRGRLRYAVTPRFAPSSSPEQLAAAGRLLLENPDVYLHTHMSENLAEIAWVEELFPHVDHYLHSYDEAGLLGRRSVFAHCIHLSDDEWKRMAESESNIAFCPTSNLFLGSGLFPLKRAEAAGIHVGLGTDVGAGTSLSLLATMGEAYKVQQLQGQNLTPWKGFYLATLGGARTLDLDDVLGNFLPGKEADFVVIDLHSTPLLKQRVSHSMDVFDLLFVLSTLGDDRAIRETWIMGECRHHRESGISL